MRSLRTLVQIFVLLLSITAGSYGQLTVRTDTYGSKPGFIDKATLVVEPHGAYVEQSLYLSYSDHNQFAPSKVVEIVHRFEMPANAVINDLWLWIGDSVMQARIMDTWTARAIYDSIVSKKRDPAFLSKTGNIYELHIFPLVSGSYRKVKLNFITPTRWLGTEGAAELPLKMLKDNNNQVRPLEILFRQTAPVWGQPFIRELGQQMFAYLIDSSGYQYKRTRVGDISPLGSFTLGFTTDFANGYFSTASRVTNDGTYFQFGFTPGAFFGLPLDFTSQHRLFAFDLSGVHNKNLATLLPDLKQLMRSAVKPNDSLSVIVAGAGKIMPLTTGWRIGNTDTIGAIIDRFAASDWAQNIAVEKLPHIIYADGHAAICWQFPGLEKLATSKNYSDMLTAFRDFKTADVIAAYDHGYEQTSLTRANITPILAELDSFFVRGGRLLSYYDFNRVGVELIGSHYIPGLTTTRRADGSTTLFRNTNGNIGQYFPESFVHYGFDYLQFAADPNVKTEVQDGLGRPVVISKRIGNGLIVVSGIWSFKDDGALRALLGVPLLGLNEVKKDQQLTGLLTDIRSRYAAGRFEKVFLASNSDSLFQKFDAQAWSASYLAGFGATTPKFTTINLLDGVGFIPPYITDGLVQYYGSGFLMKTVTDASKGQHFETHIDNLAYVIASLRAFSYPVADSLTVTASIGDGSGQLRELREVDPSPKDPNKARFFIGSATSADRIRFDVRAKFETAADPKTASATVYVPHDTSKIESVLPAMLGNEKLKEMFAAQTKDTSAIVNLAVRYRLLCDYTAFIALEPNDTIHFMKDPFDESRISFLPQPDEAMADSLALWSYPNPFNNQTNIVVNLRRQSLVSVGIYNILGQRVKVLASDELVEGRKVYHWNGSDETNRTVSSGAYFVRMIVNEKGSGRTASRFRKILFLK